ncbi:type II toxin-antitoxin system RelE/ParE family toxin [Roseibium sp. M-1]
MRLRFTAKAERDLVAIEVYFAENASPQAAANFFAQLEQLFQDILLVPERGRRVQQRQTVRLVVLRRYHFSYKIFYRQTDDIIDILSIFHASRDPNDEPNTA